jgi:hypothetical protein
MAKGGNAHETFMFCLMMLFLGLPISGKTKMILPPMMVKTLGMEGPWGLTPKTLAVRRDGVLLCVNGLTFFLYEFQKIFPLRQFELNVV